MKSYLLDLIKDLEEWSVTPTEPFERREYELNSYVGIVAGIIAEKKDSVSNLIGFNDFLDLLTKEDESGLDSIEGVTLALACCEIVNKGDLGRTVCEGLVVDKGRIVSRSGERFNLVRTSNGYCHWKCKGDCVEYCNLEYALSVILFSSVLYRHFSDTILMIFFKTFISSESEINKIKTRFEVIRRRIDIFRKRKIH